MTPEQIAAEIKSEQRRMIVGDDQAYSQGVDELLRRLRDAGLLHEGPDVDDMLEAAWCLIANAGYGNWANRDYNSQEFHDAAIVWRDRYHEWLARALEADQ